MLKMLKACIIVTIPFRMVYFYLLSGYFTNKAKRFAKTTAVQCYR